MTDNPLVDPDSQFELGDYATPWMPGTPYVGESDNYGGTDVNNPFTPGTGYTINPNRPHWFAGLPVLDVAQSLMEDVEDENWYKAFLDSAAYAAQSAGLLASSLTGDWGGMLVAPAVSWCLEHIKPLRLILDMVTGNQDMVVGVSNTWLNMSTYLVDTTEMYQKAAASTVSYWRGGDADAYRSNHAELLTLGTATAAAICYCWSQLLFVAGELVRIVHDLVRDLIAALIGQLVQDFAESFTGVGVLLIPEQTAGEIMRFTGLASSQLEALLEVMPTLFSLVSTVFGVMGSTVTVLDRLANGPDKDRDVGTVS